MEDLAVEARFTELINAYGQAIGFIYVVLMVIAVCLMAPKKAAKR